MIVFIKLLLAHLLGDFLLQPTSWVKDKEQKVSQVFKPHTVIYPGTVVIHVENASSTC